MIKQSEQSNTQLPAVQRQLLHQRLQSPQRHIWPWLVPIRSWRSRWCTREQLHHCLLESPPLWGMDTDLPYSHMLAFKRGRVSSGSRKHLFK